MKFLNYLQEEYVGSEDPHGLKPPYEIFVNPTPKELRTFTSVRFIADNRTKKFFISYSLYLHEFFVNYLRFNKLIGQTDDCFMGQGWIKLSHIDFEDFSYDWGQPPDQDMQRYKWCQKYFTEDSIKRLWK